MFEMVEMPSIRPIIQDIVTALQRRPNGSHTVKTSQGEFLVSYRPLSQREAQILGLDQPPKFGALHFEGTWRFGDGRWGQLVIEDIDGDGFLNRQHDMGCLMLESAKGLLGAGTTMTLDDTDYRKVQQLILAALA